MPRPLDRAKSDIAVARSKARGGYKKYANASFFRFDTHCPAKEAVVPADVPEAAFLTAAEREFARRAALGYCQTATEEERVAVWLRMLVRNVPKFKSEI